MDVLEQGIGELFTDPDPDKARLHFRHKSRKLENKLMPLKEAIEKYVKDENVLRRVLNRFKYGIGRDLEVAVAIIDQASIYAEVRKDNKLKIPEQNDLQGAASNIIEIADNVLILYRPELYWNSPDDEGVPNELKNMKIGDEKVSFEKKVGVIPAKQKMGGSESRLLGFDVVTTTLYSLRK